jgi:hypothetical protein
LAAADVDEFVASLEHWAAAPVITRFYAQRFAIRSLIYNGHVDRAEQLLASFTPFVADLDSRYASGLLAELRGVIAMKRQDWHDAVRWYAKAADASDTGLHSWYDLVVAWHLLTARSLCAEPAVITGADLRDPWRCYQNEHLDVLAFHGAVSTALALRRLGHHELSQRFATWAYANDTEVMPALASRLEAGGLIVTTVETTDSLDTLIAELDTIADRLEGS